MTPGQKKRHDYYIKNRHWILPKARKYQKQYYEKHPEIQSIRGIKWAFKLSKDEAIKWYKKRQKIKCQICKSSHKKKHIDHNHTTGKVRGILCVRCNSNLEWAIKYRKQIDLYFGRFAK
jgi:ribosomal protein L19E